MIGDCGGWDALEAILSGRGGRIAKNPERVVGAVLAGEDVGMELRLTLLPRNQRKRQHNQRH